MFNIKYLSPNNRNSNFPDQQGLDCQVTVPSWCFIAVCTFPFYIHIAISEQVSSLFKVFVFLPVAFLCWFLDVGRSSFQIYFLSLWRL